MWNHGREGPANGGETVDDSRCFRHHHPPIPRVVRGATPQNGGRLVVGDVSWSVAGASFVRRQKVSCRHPDKFNNSTPWTLCCGNCVAAGGGLCHSACSQLNRSPKQSGKYMRRGFSCSIVLAGMLREHDPTMFTTTSFVQRIPHDCSLWC